MLHSLRSPTRVTPLLRRVMYTGHPTGVHSKTDLISDRTGYSGLPPPAYHILLVPVTLRIPNLRFQIFFLSCTDRWQRFILTPLGVVYREIVFMGFGLNYQKTRCFLAPYISFWYLSLYFSFLTVNFLTVCNWLFKILYNIKLQLYTKYLQFVIPLFGLLIQSERSLGHSIPILAFMYLMG